MTTLEQTKAFLQNLVREGVPADLVANTQAIWDNVCYFAPTAAIPAVGCSEDYSCIGLTWRLRSYESDWFSIEVYTDGHVEWYFTTSQDHWFYENTVTDPVPSQAVSYIQRFHD